MCFCLDDAIYPTGFPTRVVVTPPVCVTPPYHAYSSTPWWNSWFAPVRMAPPIRQRVTYMSRPTPVVVTAASRMPPYRAYPNQGVHRERVVVGQPGTARVVPGYRR